MCYNCIQLNIIIRSYIFVYIFNCVYILWAACYGIVSVPTGQWFCCRCEAKESPIRAVSASYSGICNLLYRILYNWFWIMLINVLHMLYELYLLNCEKYLSRVFWPRYFICSCHFQLTPQSRQVSCYQNCNCKCATFSAMRAVPQ